MIPWRLRLEIGWRTTSYSQPMESRALLTLVLMSNLSQPMWHRWSLIAIRDYDNRMAETYSSGTWVVKAGEEDAFVEAWRTFVIWASEFPGSGTFRLARDLN